jgi:hypothetical protein
MFGKALLFAECHTISDPREGNAPLQYRHQFYGSRTVRIPRSTSIW